MKIDKVTLTGLDSVVELDTVLRLTIAYPFVEWGILFSTNREGQKRYPPMWAVQKIINADVPLSAHFCGTWAKDVLENQNYGIIKTLHPNFKRVQLNYNFSYNQKWNLAGLCLFAKENTERDIILQYNKSNADALQTFAVAFPENINILYDASGGRGTLIQNIPPAFKNYTGYAGGINSENIKSVCSKIELTAGDNNVWVDMETGIRTNDIFDLEKCEAVLSSITNF